jgi:hypothetical protein
LRQRVATLLQVGEVALVDHRVASVLDQLLGRVAGGRGGDDEGDQFAEAGVAASTTSAGRIEGVP